MAKRRILAAAAVAALAASGTAAAYTATRTVTLQPGRCATVAKTRVCAAAAKPQTVTVTPAACERAIGDANQLAILHDQLWKESGALIATGIAAIKDMQSGDTTDLAAQVQTAQQASAQIQLLSPQYDSMRGQYSSDAAGCH